MLLRQIFQEVRQFFQLKQQFFKIFSYSQKIGICLIFFV